LDVCSLLLFQGSYFPFEVIDLPLKINDQVQDINAAYMKRTYNRHVAIEEARQPAAKALGENTGTAAERNSIESWSIARAFRVNARSAAEALGKSTGTAVQRNPVESWSIPRAFCMNAWSATEAFGKGTGAAACGNSVKTRRIARAFRVNSRATPQALGENAGTGAPPERGYAGKSVTPFAVHALTVQAKGKHSSGTSVLDRCN
jgi:hypothetical protein